MRFSSTTSHGLIVPLMCLVMSNCAAAQQQPADLLVTNAKVVTVDRERPQATAFAVKDGKFIAVGSDAEMTRHRGAKTRVIDARSHTVIPGLNDSHTHVVRGGVFYNLELRWDGVDSLERGLAMIREQSKRTPKGQWVRVIGGWSPYQFKEKRMPTIKELNAAAPDTPTFVLFLYSQGMINRAAVEALGLTKGTEAPANGRFEFVDGGAILHAEPDATILYQMIAKPPQLSAADKVNSTLHFYRELNRFGLTSAVDAGGGGHHFPEDYASSETVVSKDEASIRISYYLFPQTAGKELDDFRRWTSEHQVGKNQNESLEHGFELEGGGEFITHSAGDYENFMFARPNLDERGNWKADLHAVATLLVQKRWPLRIHATYGETVAGIMDVFERIAKEQGHFAPRWAIDHAETVGDNELKRIKALGGGIAVQDRLAFAGEYFIERYGKDAASHAPPIRKMLGMGIPVGVGTDGTRVGSYNPWLALYWLVSGKTVGGTQMFSDENRLSREEALRLYTVGSAWFSQEENVKGRIAPGQYADFAILSADYLSVPEEQIKDIESSLTVVAGKIVYAASPFENLTPSPLPAVSPDWSPIKHFGGYQKKPEAGKTR
ncbi:MAG: amidohydrolase [Nitrosospira sp.]